VPGLFGVLDIRGGFGHFCALLDTGKVSCWGRNEHGQSGLPELGTSVPAPTPVKGVSGAIAIGLGAQHSCALLETGKMLCWGENGVGQLGRGNFTASPPPAEVHGL
jgi:alpha-tubulin suppressor-like RCC1 family protein